MSDTSNNEKIGLMVCGHGSRNKEAVGQFAKLAERLRPRFPDWPVDYGYLEFANPVLSNGLDKLVEQGLYTYPCGARHAVCRWSRQE